jgi:hypothetical protein
MAAWGLAHGLSHLFVTGFVSAARVRGSRVAPRQNEMASTIYRSALSLIRRLSRASSSLSPLATIRTASSGVVR